jgi:hypothetical protein
METLFVLLYWPVVGLLILFVCLALLRMGVGPWWNFLLISGPLWALSIGAFFSVKGFLHLHGLLLQIVGLVPSQRVNGFYGTLYQFWLANCFYWSTPVFPNLWEAWRSLRKHWHRKKATKAALDAGE